MSTGIRAALAAALLVAGCSRAEEPGAAAGEGATVAADSAEGAVHTPASMAEALPDLEDASVAAGHHVAEEPGEEAEAPAPP